jgi:hypothetical protein
VNREHSGKNIPPGLMKALRLVVCATGVCWPRNATPPLARISETLSLVARLLQTFTNEGACPLKY